VKRAEREARQALEQAQTYADWHRAAAELDRLEGAEAWRADDVCTDYDWQLLRGKRDKLRDFREQKAWPKLVHHLRQGLHWNLGNMANPALYGRARLGTKRLVEDYLQQVCAALDALVSLPARQFDPEERLHFLDAVARSFGRSALSLSGGATLGLFHLGVVRALHAQNLLPRVLSGSSAGAIVAAMIGTRTPQELDSLLDPEAAYYQFWRVLRFREMWSRGVLMDRQQLSRAIARNVRALTFEEAQARSQRIVNITVSPAGQNQEPRLLNHLTFPHLFLRDAVLASCALPLLFEPVMLMTRDENGQRVPYLPTLRWIDGSLKSDLPFLRLRRLHNVNHFVVSQTNPHIVPFLPEHPEAADSLRAAARRYAYGTVQHQASQLVGIARAVLPFARVRKPLEAAHGILEQDYRGHVTIQPHLGAWSYVKLMTNPAPDTVRRFVLEGERATWPKLAMIRNQTCISAKLDECLRRCGGALEQRRARRRSGAALSPR